MNCEKCGAASGVWCGCEPPFALNQLAQSTPVWAVQLGDASREIDRLRARVAELEAKHDYGDGLCVHLEEQLARANEDLSRKRDECVRLEQALAEQSRQREFYATQANCKTFEIGELAAENARLRRERRGKR